jgi:murein DD-endopeptidase MepM/ murein hydrolase activator NlpD
MAAALKRAQIAPGTAHAIVTALQSAGLNMRTVRAGEPVELARDAAGELQTVAYAPGPWLRYTATRGQEGWQAARDEIAPEIRAERREATIRSSLWDAVDSGALSPQLLLDLARMFEATFDFTADTRGGDRIRLLVEARYADDRFVEYGRILAAQYETADRRLTGVAFEGPQGFGYYDAQGRSLKRMFLRSPLEFRRISSRFTYRRPHPILGGVTPHLAIDYAAPVGTPVWAVADGEVRVAGWNGGNGIQVRLRHRGGYETYYNHLSRVGPGIAPGVRVTQRQVIGYVGSTGLSTGPHLDYRVSQHGRFLDPLREDFLPGEPVPPALRAQFDEHAQRLLAAMAASPAATPAYSAGADRPRGGS